MNAINVKVTLMIDIFVRAIMGDDTRSESIIKEALLDKQIYDNYSQIVTDIDQSSLVGAIGYLGSIGEICEKLNELPGTAREKDAFIIEKALKLMIARA